MSLTSRLRVLLACVVLQIGVFAGVPMRPEEVEKLFSEMNQPRLAHVLPSENDNGMDPPATSK